MIAYDVTGELTNVESVCSRRRAKSQIPLVQITTFSNDHHVHTSIVVIVMKVSEGYFIMSIHRFIKSIFVCTEVQ